VWHARIAVASDWHLGSVVDCEYCGAVWLNVSEARGGGCRPVEIIHEAVSGVGSSEEVPTTVNRISIALEANRKSGRTPRNSVLDTCP
jgi:hypothetical protein